jgi:hypothetical protein
MRDESVVHDFRDLHDMKDARSDSAATAIDPHSGEWHSFNDATVWKVTQAIVHSARAYVLFYGMDSVAVQV